MSSNLGQLLFSEIISFVKLLTMAGDKKVLILFQISYEI